MNTSHENAHVKRPVVLSGFPDQKISDLIEIIVHRILSVVSPEKIILYGSYAKGSVKEESDIDIMIVMNSDIPRHKRSIPIYRILLDIKIPKDILVYTPEEIESWSGVSSAFITSAIKSGIVIYDKNQSGLSMNI